MGIEGYIYLLLHDIYMLILILLCFKQRKGIAEYSPENGIKLGTGK